MAAYERHPLTQVQLNPIVIERPSLSWAESLTIWLMRLDRAKQSTIAAALGTNMARVNEVLKGRRHPKAKAAALKLLGRKPK